MNTFSWTGSTLDWSHVSAALRTAGLAESKPEVETAEARPEVAGEETVAPAARFLHVVEQGALLRKAGSRVRVQRDDRVLLDVPMLKLQGVFLYGNVQVSTQCMRKLLDAGVWLSFFATSGQYKGRIQPPAERGGRLRLLQWERYQDADFRLRFGRAVVRGKVRSQIGVAQAIAKNYLADAFASSYESLRGSLGRVDEVGSAAELRGVEGAASRSYFDLFRRWNRSEWEFPGRAGRGAQDPINCLLNFGYAMATRELEGFLEAAGLDPTIGFYHVPDGDRPSLACDWVEEFRHALVDRLVLRLINTRVIQSEHFEEREKGGLRLHPDGLRKYLAAYEKALAGSEGFRARMVGQLGRLLDAMDSGGEYTAWNEGRDEGAVVCCT